MMTGRETKQTGVDDSGLPSGPPPTPRDIGFFSDPVVDHLIRAVVSLTMELSVTRDRLRSVEKILSRDGLDVSIAIDNLALSEAEDAARRSEHERLVKSILCPFLALDAPKTYGIDS